MSTRRTLPSAWDEADKHNQTTDETRARGKRRHATKAARRKAFFAATHLYQLMRGDVPFGKPRELGGQEAFELNKQYERDYIAALDAGKADARMYRLKWLRTLRDGDGNEVTPETCPIIANNKRRQYMRDSRPYRGGLARPSDITHGSSYRR